MPKLIAAHALDARCTLHLLLPMLAVRADPDATAHRSLPMSLVTPAARPRYQHRPILLLTTLPRLTAHAACSAECPR